MADRFDDKRINEALALLNEVAKDKKANMEQTIGDKYSELKSLAETLRANGQEKLANALADGKERAKKVASDVDESVHRHPWHYIGGAALVSLLLGIIIGRSRK